MWFKITGLRDLVMHHHQDVFVGQAYWGGPKNRLKSISAAGGGSERRSLSSPCGGWRRRRHGDRDGGSGRGADDLCVGPPPPIAALDEGRNATTATAKTSASLRGRSRHDLGGVDECRIRNFCRQAASTGALLHDCQRLTDPGAARVRDTSSSGGQADGKVRDRLRRRAESRSGCFLIPKSPPNALSTVIISYTSATNGEDIAARIHLVPLRMCRAIVAHGRE